jgi:Fe-S-cluster containining protein
MTSPHLKWYAEGLKFECERCGTCCTGEPGCVWVTPDEADSIAHFLGLFTAEFAAKYLRRAGSHDSLIELPDGRCIFYNDKGCGIYAVRPRQCRTFPFWPSIIASREAWTRCQEECPGIGKGRLFSAEEIEALLRPAMTDGRGPKLYPR